MTLKLFIFLKKYFSLNEEAAAPTSLQISIIQADFQLFQQAYLALFTYQH